MSIIRLCLIALWSIFSITLSAFVALITFSPKIAVGMARWFWSPLIIAFAGAQIKVKNRNSEFVKLNPCVVVANHTSFFDIPVLFRTIPFNVHFVAKKELKKMPFVGWYVVLTKMIFIDRSNRIKAYESLKKAGKLIRKGKSVITFPEGSRSSNESITMFKQGSFQLAIEAEVPIVPVKIVGASKVWPANSMQLKPGKVHVIFGEPIYPEKFKTLEPKALAKLVQDKVEALA